MGARLGRGKNYAQLGQIRTFTVEPGCLTAEVQGVDPIPYSVSVQMEPIDSAALDSFLEKRPFLAAQLAAHHLPIAFEEGLHTLGTSLIPQTRKEVTFHCTCKDWARPCKHLAAALCLFADAMSSDPHLLLRFRGLIFPEATPALAPRIRPTETISHLHPIPNGAAIPKRLGTLPYWRGSEDFRKSLEAAYTRAHAKALTALEGTADLRFPEDMV